MRAVFLPRGGAACPGGGRVVLTIALLWALACGGAALPAFAQDASSAGDGELVFLPAPRIAAPTEQPLLDIARAGDRLVAVGASGLIILSDDNGGSWRQAPVPVSATLTAVAFPTATEGWAVGHAGVILHSDDAGESWALQFDGYRANQLFLAYAGEQRERLEARMAALDDRAADAEEGADGLPRDELEYALEEAIFLEEDAQLAVETGPADPFLDVAFRDAGNGVAVGAYGMFFRTTDGGESWRVSLDGVDNPGRFHLYSLNMDAAGGLQLAGEAGLLFASSPGEAGLRRFYDVYEGSLFGVLSYQGGVLTFGLRGNQFFLPRDGEQWAPRPSDNDTSLYGGTALADGSALLLGAGGRVLRLQSDGREVLFQHPSRSTFSAAVEGSDGTLWLVGMEGLSRLAEAEVVAP